ncbi:MAG: hypothetical protein AB7J40_05440 [Candidatus Altimarinota bacterium]
MSKWFIRSVVLGVCLLLVQSGAAAFNFSDVSEVIRKGPSQGLSAVQNLRTGAGKGMYMTIYEDTVRSPNRLVEEQIKKRFGIDFKVDLSLPSQQGQFIFTDFFKNPGGALKNPSAPILRSSLQSDCVRFRATSAEERVRMWKVVKQRLEERRIKENDEDIPADPQNPVDQAVILQLVEAIDDETATQIQDAFTSIPEYRDLTEQQALLRCYEDLSEAVDFELRLQSLLHPSRKKLEALQTFVNGRLDDFTRSVPLTDVSYGTSFPKYDLLFDLDVIDLIFFGSSLETRSGQSGQAGAGIPKDADFDDYESIVAATAPRATSSATGAGTGSAATGVSGTAAGMQSVNLSGGFENHSGAFGASGNQFAGPQCVDTWTGLNLDYSALTPSGQALAPTSPARPAPSTGASSSSGSSPVRAPDSISPLNTAPVSSQGGALTQEGLYEMGKNRKALCEGTIGVDLGNDLLQLLFCIDIRFAKLGKTWQTSQEETCIACFIRDMNRVFEDIIFKASVRPHKNTGTIMESGICEDGYGDDVGFFSFIEWVPVKFYPDICYPKGGVTDSQYAELVGYPEIVNRINHSGFVDCEVHFEDEEAQERCREAIGGTSLSLDEFRTAYLNNVDQRIENVTAGDVQANVWSRLVGMQGVVERQVHVYLYRLGKDEERYGESKKISQDLKEKLDYLQQTMNSIRQDPSLVVNVDRDQKVEQLLCLKGYFYGSQQAGESKAFNCRTYQTTFREFEEEIARENQRLYTITRRWNTRSKDFHQNNRCNAFAGGGLIAAFEQEFGGLTSDYFFQTDARKSQTPQEQVTGQITANTDINDLNRLFSLINEQIATLDQTQAQQQLKSRFVAEQQRSLQLYRMADELTSFRTILQSYTDWWAKMVTDLQFVSKGGQRISVLQSFLEKLK